MSEIPTIVPPSGNKRLALFLDGTTDKSEGNTNVWRARCLCAGMGADGAEQKIYYAAGVGTQLGEIVRGDVFGCGIDDQVLSAYGWLIENYEDGDEIVIFGLAAAPTRREACLATYRAAASSSRGRPSG